MSATKSQSTKVTKTENTNHTKAPRRKKEGLRKPQIRILEALSKAKGPMSRKLIAEAASVDIAWCTEFVGSADKEQNTKTESRTGFKTLIGLGFIKARSLDVEGKKETVHDITASGKVALKKATAK